MPGLSSSDMQGGLAPSQFNTFPKCTSKSNLYHTSAGEDDGQAKGRHNDPCGEENGQFFAGITSRVCIIHHTARDAVWDRRQDVEEEKKEWPIFAMGTNTHNTHQPLIHHTIVLLPQCIITTTFHTTFIIQVLSYKNVWKPYYYHISRCCLSKLKLNEM